MCGVFPLGEVKHLLFGHSLISVPFCVYGGVLADDDGMREALEAHAIRLARISVSGISRYATSSRYATTGCARRGCTSPSSAQLSEDHDANLSAIPRKQRAMVRKGIKAGLVGELDDGIDNLYQAYSESVRNLGTPVFPKGAFSRDPRGVRR